MRRLGGLAFGLAGTSEVLYISDIMLSFNHDKSISISDLVNGELRCLQKVLKYFNGTSSSAFNVLLSFGMLPINFVLYSKDILVICYGSVVIYSIIISIFISIIIHFIFILIPQTSWYYRIIVTAILRSCTLA